MTDEEIAHAEQTATTPVARLAVVLAAAHAAREEAMRGLLLEHLDFAAGTVTLDGHPQRMGTLTRTAMRAWLAERKARRPHTLNRHVLVSQQTAGTTRPVSNYFLKRQLTLHGVSLARIRADRVLGEALATGADPLHLTVLFDLSPATAVKYAELARRLLHGSFDQQPNPGH
ncbi:hypothetical protein [Embleya sp. AB8]|uniref:hypothetical protein n=1 Tax=Embleya sp. AB8 TaxID=3156304 RepID=UPI003C70D91B